MIGGKRGWSQHRKGGGSDWREERLVTAQEEIVIGGKRGWLQHRKRGESDWREERLVTAQEERRE